MAGRRDVAAPDRWHQLLNAIRDSNMSAADTSVYRYLLDKADYGTALLPPEFTPRQQTISRKTRISLRQVKYAIGHLRRHGWLTTAGKTGPGKTLAYSLAAGTSCDCTGRVHDHRLPAERVQRETVTGATFGHRSGATNGCNAAGQNGRQTRGTEREGEEAPEQQRGQWDGLTFAQIMEATGSDPWR